VKRQYTKKGDLMARFILEDLQAQMEVWVFPRVMADYGMLLENDAVVVVRGRIDLRDEQPKIVAMDVRRPVLSATDSEPLRIALPISVLTDDTVERLKEILTAHPGSSAVLLHVGEKCCACPPSSTWRRETG